MFNLFKRKTNSMNEDKIYPIDLKELKENNVIESVLTDEGEYKYARPFLGNEKDGNEINETRISFKDRINELLTSIFERDVIYPIDLNKMTEEGLIESVITDDNHYKYGTD